MQRRNCLNSSNFANYLPILLTKTAINCIITVENRKGETIMIDKYYLIKYVYNTPELTSNVFWFCDGALRGVLAGFATSTPKAPEEYTDYDWGMLYDKRVSDIDRAMRAYISASGTYDGDDVVSLIDQYNNIMEQLETARDLFIKYDAHGQIDGGEECSFKQFLRTQLGVYGALAND